MTEPEFKPEESGRILEIQEEGWVGQELQYRKLSTFRPDGNIESEVYYDSSDRKGTTVVYSYDEEGKLIQREFQHPDAAVPDRETYVWDENGRLLSVERLYTTGKYGWRFEYSYDEKGRLVLVTKIDRYWKDVIVWEKSFAYDIDGLLITSEGGGLDENIHWYDEYIYDVEGRLTGRLKYDLEKELVSRTEYEYGGGVVVKEVHKDGKDNVVREIDFYYEYNPEGFWKEKQLGFIEDSGRRNYFRPVSRYIRFFVYRNGEDS